jgi:hypothetical protein
MALTGGLEATATSRAFCPARDGCCTHGLRDRHNSCAAEHLAFYALAFARRLEEARFAVEIFRLPPAEAMVCGLLPMKWLYVAICPQARET